MIITIDTNLPAPGPFDTDEAYCQFVMSNAALSYQAQYSTATTDEGITAARAAYNASLPAPQEAAPAPALQEPAPAPAPAPEEALQEPAPALEAAAQEPQPVGA